MSDGILVRTSPVDDRDEFKKRLERTNSILDRYSVEELFEAILSKDQSKLDEINQFRAECKSHVDNQLSLYDSAKDRGEKEKVVQEVKKFQKEKVV